MITDVIQIFGLFGCIIIMWFQRKTIFELQKDIWELEKAYKAETNKVYHYKHRQFQLWGNDGGNKNE